MLYRLSVQRDHPPTVCILFGMANEASSFVCVCLGTQANEFVHRNSKPRTMLASMAGKKTQKRRRHLILSVIHKHSAAHATRGEV